jgi:predicted O-methyltransferase YrrM
MPLMTYVRGRDIPGSARRLFIAAPTTDKFHPPFVASLFESVHALSAAGIQADLCIEAGNCHVDDARNSLVRKFLQTDCTDLVFIDADVGFRAADLVKLAGFDRAVVAGVYPKKQDEESFPIHTAPGVRLQAEADGCISEGILGLPTGFMRIQRHVIEQMAEAYADRGYLGQGAAEADAPYIPLFERETAEGRRWSGDYNFCRRWRAMGGALAVDPSMVFVHEGAKRWAGQLGDFWKRAHGVYRDAFQDAVEALKRGDARDEVFLALHRGWANQDWSGTADLIQAAYYMARRARGPIVETGSGLTTLVMAIANPNVEVHALENDPTWSRRVAVNAARHDLSNIRLHIADLEADGFYDLGGLPAGAFSLALLDGPPRWCGDRSAAYAKLGPQLRGAMLLVDDVNDAHERIPMEAFAEAQGLEIHTHEEAGKSFAICLPKAERKAA